MTYFKDLEPCNYLGDLGGRMRAVGWLERGYPYAEGSVSERFFEALVELLVNPWQPAACAGTAACSLCQFTGGPSRLRYKGKEIALGSSSVYVPTEEAVYVAPSMIAHYIDAHGYQPPEEFQRAVLECPAMRSMQYLRMVKKHGIQKLGAT